MVAIQSNHCEIAPKAGSTSGSSARGRTMSQSLTIDAVHEAIREGAATKDEIADYIGKDPSHTNRKLKDWVENDEVTLDRQWNHGAGGGYIYTIPAGDAVDEDEDLPILGSRDYDWDRFVPDPDETVDYEQAESEFDEIQAVLETRDDTGQLPRFQISGPTGCGKTTLVQSLAAERGAPLLTIQCSYALRGSELLGTPQIVGGDVMWVDGPLTRLLLASKECDEVFGLIDEVNRATARAKGELFPSLDHRAEVTIKSRGNEVISGDALSLVTVATMNEGQEYEVESLDAAEERRLGLKWELPYLGVNNPKLEAGLVAKKAPIDEYDALPMVKAANKVREAADDESEPQVRRGIPTSAVISWGQSAASFAEAGLADPVGRAMKVAVIKPLFSDNAGKVAGMLHTGLKSANADPTIAGVATDGGDHRG